MIGLEGFLNPMDLLWVGIVALGYVIIPIIIATGKDWEVPKQKNLVKAITIYLAGVFVGFLEWIFYETTFAKREVDPIITIIVLLLEFGLIGFTWVLMMKMWG